MARVIIGMNINLKLKNFLLVLVPFGLTQALGIFAAYRFLPQIASEAQVDWRGFSVADFAVLVIFVAIFFLFAIKFKKAGSVFYKVFLSLIIFSGSQAIFGVWFAPLLATLLALALLIIFWLHQSVLIHDLTMILVIAGIGAVIGLSLSPMTVVYVLIIFSFYDIISVYKTGHMIKLAEAMIKSRAIFGLVIPDPGRRVREKVSGIVPGQGFMILGSGDIVFPLLLSASLVRVSLWQAVLVAIFSIGGLFLMHLIFVNQQDRRPMAALPPIALMSIMGYLVSMIL